MPSVSSNNLLKSYIFASTPKADKFLCAATNSSSVKPFSKSLPIFSFFPVPFSATGPKVQEMLKLFGGLPPPVPPTIVSKADIFPGNKNQKGNQFFQLLRKVETKGGSWGAAAPRPKSSIKSYKNTVAVFYQEFLCIFYSISLKIVNRKNYEAE